MTKSIGNKNLDRLGGPLEFEAYAWPLSSSELFCSFDLRAAQFRLGSV